MNCSQSFTSAKPKTRKRVSEKLKRKLVYDYIRNYNSLPMVAEDYGLHPSSISRWMLQECPDPPKEGFAPVSDFSGYFCIDGKVIKISGKKHSLLWACDAKTQKLLGYYFSENENVVSTKSILSSLKDMLSRKVIGITSDFGKGRCFLKQIKDFFPEAKHQICLVHFQRYVDLKLPSTRKSKYFWRNEIFHNTVKAIIKAPSKEDALFLLQRLLSLKKCFPASYHRTILRSLNRNFDLLTTYMENPDLPATSNSIESWNSKFDRKYKNLNGFKAEKSCLCFLKMWFEYQTMMNNK